MKIDTISKGIAAGLVLVMLCAVAGGGKVLRHDAAKGLHASGLAGDIATLELDNGNGKQIHIGIQCKYLIL
jgi:hypothetical protein